MKIIREKLEFKRGQEPSSSLGIGRFPGILGEFNRLAIKNGFIEDTPEDWPKESPHEYPKMINHFHYTHKDYSQLIILVYNFPEDTKDPKNMWCYADIEKESWDLDESIMNWIDDNPKKYLEEDPWFRVRKKIKHLEKMDKMI